MNTFPPFLPEPEESTECRILKFVRYLEDVDHDEPRNYEAEDCVEDDMGPIPYRNS